MLLPLFQRRRTKRRLGKGMYSRKGERFDEIEGQVGIVEAEFEDSGCYHFHYDSDDFVDDKSNKSDEEFPDYWIDCDVDN
jgi:hypothetical protein